MVILSAPVLKIPNPFMGNFHMQDVYSSYTYITEEQIFRNIYSTDAYVSTRDITYCIL